MLKLSRTLVALALAVLAPIADVEGELSFAIDGGLLRIVDGVCTGSECQGKELYKLPMDSPEEMADAMLRIFNIGEQFKPGIVNSLDKLVAEKHVCSLPPLTLTAARVSMLCTRGRYRRTGW